MWTHAEFLLVLPHLGPQMPLNPRVGNLQRKGQTLLLFRLEWSWIPSKSIGSCKLSMPWLHLTRALATAHCRALLFISLPLSAWLFATAHIRIRLDRSKLKVQYLRGPQGFQRNCWTILNPLETSEVDFRGCERSMGQRPVMSQGILLPWGWIFLCYKMLYF